MQKISASELRRAIAQGKDDPIFKARWISDGEEHAVLVRASTDKHVRNLARNMLNIDPDFIRPLTASEMLDDSIISEAAALNLERNGYHMYEAHA